MNYDLQPNQTKPNQTNKQNQIQTKPNQTNPLRQNNPADLGVRLDLKQIALRCRNTEFNPRRFAAVVMRLREPRATALLFSSGRMVVTGTKSSHNSSLATKKFAYILERVGFQPQSYIDFKVQNIVGTVDVGFPIRLEGVVYAHPTFSSYEPELFPGLIYRLVQPRVVLLIFVSGKVVITGAKKEDDLVEGLRKVYPVLLEFRKATVTPVPGGFGTFVAGQGGGVAATAVAPAVAVRTHGPVPTLPPIVAGNVASLGKGGRGRGSGGGKEMPRVRRGKDLNNTLEGHVEV
ncbi:hypothetical protein ACHAXS_012223 [Conticribra weissflogii]